MAASSSPEKFLLEVFVGEVINAFAPDPTNIHGRVFDLRSAAGRRIFSPLLAAGFDATALIFIGQRDQNQKFLTAGNNQYNRVLRLLQKTVDDPEQCTSTDALTMVVLLTVIEVSIMDCDIWRPLTVLPMYANRRAGLQSKLTGCNIQTPTGWIGVVAAANTVSASNGVGSISLYRSTNVLGLSSSPV